MNITKKILPLIIVLTSNLFADTANKTSFTNVKTSSNGKVVYRNIPSKINAENSFQIYSLQSTNITSFIAPAITKPALNYPNPFQLASGTHIGYELSKDMQIQIKIYDMLGHCIAKINIKEGDEGGKGQPHYNKIFISKNSFNGIDIPSGIYIYVILHNGKILGKEKMSIIP